MNLCGEGEHLGAINVNLFDPSLLTRKLETILMSGLCIRADATQVPLLSNSADEVVGNMLPYSPEWTDGLVAEAIRILRPGGTCRMYSSTVGGAGLLPHFQNAGFTDVKLLEAGQAFGLKP